MTRPKASQREAWTPLGAAWWDWQPLAQASPCARLLWLALYTSAPARRCPPGLWQGGPAVMAEVANLELDQVELALAHLIDLRLVEYDPGTRVARLTVLPDRCDRPANGDQIRSWWTRWRTLPQCTVRDSHAATLQALVGTFTRHHQEAWDATFATAPAPLRVPARPPVGHGAPHGGGHRDGHGAPSSQVSEMPGSGHRVPHGGGHRQGEGEGSSSLPEDPDSGSRSSREISRAQGGGDPLTAAGWEAFERRRGDDPAQPLARGALDRFGPRHGVPEGPSASSSRYK